jgi:hypothetical protein
MRHCPVSRAKSRDFGAQFGVANFASHPGATSLRSVPLNEIMR